MSPRRGPDLGDIDDGATPEHRVWLTSLRTAYAESELSFQEIVEKAVCSQGLHVFSKKGGKGKVSELLRGKGRYPRWRPVQAVVKVLAPTELVDYEEKWKTGAAAAGRKSKWINACLHEVRREPGRSPVTVRRAATFAAVGIGLAVGAVTGSFLARHVPSGGAEPTPTCHKDVDCSDSHWPGAPPSDPYPAAPPATTPPPEATSEPLPYVTFPPVITPDSVRVRILDSIPVYESPKRDSPKARTKPVAKFYLSCQDQEFFKVAGSKYWVTLESLEDTGADTDWWRLDGLRKCDGTSNPSVPPGTSATPTP